MLTRSRAAIALIAACLLASILTATPASAATPTSCTVVDTGTGFDLSWDQTEADAVIVFRSVDGGNMNWRGRVDAPGLTFPDGGLPNGAVSATYEIRHRVDPNNGPAIPCLPAGAPAGPTSCTVVDTGTGFDLSWDQTEADAVIVFRSVDGGNMNWRGRVDAPGLTFPDGGLPNGAVSATYEIRHRVDPNNGPAIPCLPPPPGACDVLETVDGYTVRWDVPAGTNDVVIQRSVDGGTYNWREKLAAWNTRFNDGELPAGASTVDYEVRLETNTGTQIQCTNGGLDPVAETPGSPYQPPFFKADPTLPPPLPAPVAGSDRPAGTVPYSNNTCATLSSSLDVIQPGQWVADRIDYQRNIPLGYVWLPDDYQINGKGFAEVYSQWQDIPIGAINNYVSFAQNEPDANNPGNGRIHFDSLSRQSYNSHLYPGPYASPAPGGQYVVIGFNQRWGFNAATGSVEFQWIHDGLEPIDPANIQPQAPAPCTIFQMMDLNYDLGVEAGILFGEDWLDQLQVQGETLLALGMGFIPGYDCVDAINNGINGWNAAGCIADLLGVGITLDLLRTADNVAVTIRSGDDIYGLIDEIPAAQWADELEDGLDDLPAWWGVDCVIAGNSFGAATPVLMADGTYKPISDIAVGDHVATALPGTSSVLSAEVLRTIVHLDDLVDTTFSNGDTLVTTNDHRFWNQTDGEWQEIQDFDPGDLFQTADGSPVSLDALLSESFVDDAYTLDVDGPSTFFVSGGTSDLLVHNCNASNTLRADLIAAGRPTPTATVPNNGSWQAHHILPLSEVGESANGVVRNPELRRVLEILVDEDNNPGAVLSFLNSADNGAHLPTQRPPGYTGQLHNGSHTYAATDSYTQVTTENLRVEVAETLGLEDEWVSWGEIADELENADPADIAASLTSIKDELGSIGNSLENDLSYTPLNARAHN